MAAVDQLCQRCGGAFAVRELELDLVGRLSCRRCRAYATVGEANAMLSRQGVYRRCGRCRAPTLRPEVEEQTATRSLSSGSGDDQVILWEGGWVTTGYVYACSSCGARRRFLRTGSVAFVVVAFIVGAVLNFVIHRSLPFAGLILLVPTLVVGVEGFRRHRNPPV